MTGIRRQRIAIVGMGVVALLAACSPGDPFEPLPEPGPPPAPTTSTTAQPDFRSVVLAPVNGTTSTTEVVVGPGPSTLGGRVDGPDGPVPGATVRLERLVGDASASLDVTTGPDGLWQAAGVLGGRYRIRAWRSPDLALVEPQILFVEAARAGEVTLVLERPQGLAVDIAFAPDPPQVDARVNLLVRISTQIVGEDGVVRATPQAGLGLTLGIGSGWTAESPIQLDTDATGSATFTLVCRAAGPQALMVTLPGAVALPPGSFPPGSPPPAPQVFTLSPPECVTPPPPSAPAPDETVPNTGLLPDG